MLTDTERDRLSAMTAELQRRRDSRFNGFFGATGPVRRDLYLKHLEFFAAGAQFKERLFMAANRVGKSEAGAYEVTCHATGLYPSWWTGRGLTTPVEIWASGTNSQTTRDIVRRSCSARPGAGHGHGAAASHRVDADRSRAARRARRGADPACLGRPERARVQDVRTGPTIVRGHGQACHLGR